MGPLRVAIGGLGTVGAAVADILISRKDLIAARCGRQIELVAVSARDRSCDRGVDLSGVEWFDDAAEMAASADANVILELIGGENGIAKAVCENAIGAGRHVVTANKACWRCGAVGAGSGTGQRRGGLQAGVEVSLS